VAFRSVTGQPDGRVRFFAIRAGQGDNRSVGELPHGTVTLLFSDIEGSTRLLRELGDGYADALTEHRRLLREAFASHGGVEVDTQGDAFFIAFPDAAGAVAAAAEAQSALERGPVRVRMGVHTGAPTVTAEGYVGEDVHLGARIAASGHGGQVLLSKSTREVVGRAEVRDLGEHRLKDFDQPVWIYQLGDALFPPLKTISNTNLPRPTSSFVGRELEVAEVVSLLREGARLVSLTGPGGSGKTRLAIEAAAELVGEFRNGVFWVGLAMVRGSELVPATVAQALGAQEELHVHVGEKELLLLLDNLEQVVEAAPQLAALVEACPNLKLLVTSRELLRVRGEVEYEVLPLGDPDAVELFRLRSGLAASVAIGELCRRLDNMPLAVELAAARTKVLSPEQILERLSQRLDLLKGGRDADPRQQTLRATIEWSYELLTPEEQRLFARLAVFAGGCTLDAAVAVVGADLDTLQSLIEKSLVRHTSERFWMLETIREYAAERLEASGEADALRRRHAEFLLGLAESAHLSFERIEAGERYELVIPEADNLRSAVDWALAAGDDVLAASIAVALERYWVTNSPHEGARRLAQILERSEALPLDLRARALRVRGGTTYIVGEFAEGTRWYESALAAFRELGNEAGIAHMLFRLAVEANRQGDHSRARALCDESLSLHRSMSGEAQVLSLLGDIAFAEGKGEEALRLLRDSARLAGEAGFRWWRKNALVTLAEYAVRMGKPDDARGAARDALADSQSIGDRQGMIYGIALLAWVAVGQGREEEAGRLWGAIEADVERAPVGHWENERDDYAQRVVASSAGFERGRADGHQLSLSQAAEEGLSAID
jgi:predicted ATPase/class 3 adenylate cyclase